MKKQPKYIYIMISNRGYKTFLSREKALQEIHNYVGDTTVEAICIMINVKNLTESYVATASFGIVITYED